MKAKEFIIELNKELKPRNFVAKHASLAGKAGQHKDKKKAEKQGDVKHKKQSMPTESVATIPPEFPDHWSDEEKRAAWNKWIRDGTKKSIEASKHVQDLANQIRKRQQGVGEGERSEMDTPEFQRALASLKKKAQQGPMKTVYDPKTGKYKVVPVTSKGE
jgi:hypothetical protein